MAVDYNCVNCYTVWTDIFSITFNHLLLVLTMYKIALEVLGRLAYVMLGATITVILFTYGVI